MSKQDADSIGLEQLAWLADHGARFTKPNAGSKIPLYGEWQHTPYGLNDARAHVKRGGNVGILTGEQSGGLILLDLDRDFDAMTEALGPYAQTTRIVRDNAPGRGKLLFRVAFPVESLAWTPDGWKPPEGEKESPWAELLAEGRHGMCPPSTFEGGRYILANQDAGIMALGEDDLAAVWASVTVWRPGLAAQPKADGEAQREGPKDGNAQHGDAARLVKDAWDPVSVFAHHGWATETKAERGETRLLGHGGLLCKEGGWYCHADQTGGDAIDAWAYATRKRTKVTGREFWNVLREMADAKGLPLPNAQPRPYTNGVGPDHAHGEGDALPERPHDTDMGNARRMYARTKDRLFYVPHFGRWYTWAETHWAEDQTFKVLDLAKRTVIGMYAELADCLDDNERKARLKWIRQSESRTRLESMIALLRSEPGVSVLPDTLDRHPMLLPCRNGTIDLATGELLPADPAHKLTRALAIDFDPGATCPLWESFLIRVMGGDLELVSFLQRLIGHALTGDVSGKYLVFLYGPSGNNGKSTLLEAVIRLLGPFALKSPTEMVMARGYRGGIPNDIARLRGVRFTVTNEVDSGMTISESVVKDLTGGDTLTARFMREEFFDFRPTHKLWMVGNHKPEIRGTDPAIWDRVKLVPFNVEIPEAERDTQLGQKLAGELPGILAWAVRGCLAWQRDGLKTPAKVTDAVATYQAEQDTLGQFLADCCEVDRSYTVGSGQLYQAYEAWAKQTGGIVQNGNKFGAEMERRGFKGDRLGGIRSRLGLRLNAYGRGLLPAATPHFRNED